MKWKSYGNAAQGMSLVLLMKNPLAVMHAAEPKN